MTNTIFTKRNGQMLLATAAVIFIIATIDINTERNAVVLEYLREDVSGGRVIGWIFGYMIGSMLYLSPFIASFIRQNQRHWWCLLACFIGPFVGGFIVGAIGAGPVALANVVTVFSVVGWIAAWALALWPAAATAAPQPPAQGQLP